MYKEITACRVWNKDLVLEFDLGRQSLTGVFPTESDQEVQQGQCNWFAAMGRILWVSSTSAIIASKRCMGLIMAIDQV